MSKRVLVVAAHADDEVLGCGGTIARHVVEGDEVRVVFLADGVSARPAVVETAGVRRDTAAERAARLLGVSRIDAFRLPDNRLDQMALLDIVQQLEPVIRDYRPSRIYTHHGGDLNVDHRIALQSVLTACRPQPGCSVREILAFEVLSSTGWNDPGLLPFVPNWFVDISASMETKMAALAAYSEEMRPAPHVRSEAAVRHLAALRGHSVGVVAAEAFVLMRSVQLWA